MNLESNLTPTADDYSHPTMANEAEQKEEEKNLDKSKLIDDVIALARNSQANENLRAQDRLPNPRSNTESSARERCAPRRRSRASFKSIALDDAVLQDLEKPEVDEKTNPDMSTSSFSTNISIDTTLLREFGMGFPRDSRVVTRERRQSRISITSLTLDDALLQEIEESDL